MLIELADDGHYTSGRRIEITTEAVACGDDDALLSSGTATYLTSCRRSRIATAADPANRKLFATSPGRAQWLESILDCMKIDTTPTGLIVPGPVPGWLAQVSCSCMLEGRRSARGGRKVCACLCVTENEHLLLKASLRQVLCSVCEVD